MDINTIEQIKKIIATFLKVDGDFINNDTVIDRSAVKGSIMIHRMYAAIARELKHEMKNYGQIKTFGDLLEVCGLEAKKNKSRKALLKIKENTLPKKREEESVIKANKSFSIGIDLEEVDNMPKAADFREDIFYLQNFSQKEISCCILQPDPLQSFAGKFAAKEAIVKADNSYRGVPFSKIEIDTDSSGNPYFMNFKISISHTDKFAIAVVMTMP